MNLYTVRKATQGLANYIRRYAKEGCNKSLASQRDPGLCF